MADLKNMTGTEAFQLAKDESALTIEEIAERLTVSPSVIKRYLNAGDNYLPSLEMIPRLCSTLGNNILLRWLEAQVEAEENAVPPAQNRTEVLTSVVRAGAALGNVQRILAETQVIVPHNARKLRSALNDVITECRVAKESLQPLAARKDLAECTHILCMKKASFDKENLFQLAETAEKKLIANEWRRLYAASLATVFECLFERRPRHVRAALLA